MSLVHTLTGEHSRFRRWTLYLFARYVELPLMYWGYLLLRGRYRRLGRNRLVRAAMGWAIAASFGYLGDTARPVPASQLRNMIDALDGPIAVGSCRRRATHRGCEHPLETDIVFRTGVEAWTRAFPHEYRLIDKEEAKHILSECAQMGMWPMVFVHCPAHEERYSAGEGRSLADRARTGINRPAADQPALQEGSGSFAGLGAHRAPMQQGNEYVICNCCTCGCVPYILNRELGQHVYPLLRGDYVAYTDLERCTGHGECVAACPFDVRDLVDGQARLAEPCYGCGVCVAACPEQAIVMLDA